MNRLRPLAVALLLFAMDVYICRELFTAGFIANTETNEGCFVALSRFFREHWNHLRWFPWFNAGMPIENAYQPLLPATAALTAALSKWPLERAFHFVLALAYCGGPVALFWFAWDWSRCLTFAGVAGFAWALLSPTPLLIPILRVAHDGHWQPLRIYNLIHYAEDPHTLALSLLPIALLFLRRAIVQRTSFAIFGAVVSCAAVVLSNMFGAVDLAIGALCLTIALGGGFRPVLLTGAVSWLLISPWLPPSLIEQIHRDQNGHSFGAAALVIALFLSLAYVTRKIRRPEDRFSLFFALWFCAIPIAFFQWNVTLIPQGNRYQLEMELALSLLLAAFCARLPFRPFVIAALVAIGLRQTILVRHAAHDLIRPINIAATLEYKVVKWIDGNLPDERVMLAGDPQFLFNVFSDDPQMSAGHDPTAPNWMQRVAVYMTYTGEGAGPRDAEYSAFWLKAFGNRAVYVPGPRSREFYHGVVHPRKFEGVLPVLWHEEDDTIYEIPQPSHSLAHVVPKLALVTRAPVNGIDLTPARAYVAALDDASLPPAHLHWNNPSEAVIQAKLAPGQAISVQETWAPGWRAETLRGPARVYADALGLIAIEPSCQGDCRVRLTFGASTEAWLCRAFSAFAAFLLLALLADAKRGKNAVQNFVGIHRARNRREGMNRGVQVEQ